LPAFRQERAITSKNLSETFPAFLQEWTFALKILPGVFFKPCIPRLDFFLPRSLIRIRLFRRRTTQKTKNTKKKDKKNFFVHHKNLLFIETLDVND